MKRHSEEDSVLNISCHPVASANCLRGIFTSTPGVRSITLLCGVLLQEYQLQRRPTTWGIFDILQGLRHESCSIPIALRTAFFY